jgi:hypothetical protein
MHRVDVPASTPGARPYTLTRNASFGPAGGFTPAGLAKAYGYDPAAHRSGQLVAIVDWFDDPTVRSDLNEFDAQYGLPKETAKSFRKVNQRGKTSPLPDADHDASVEIALDVQAVRAVCHTCRILLVEADEPSAKALAAAENTAVRLGATVVSNSWGAPEEPGHPAPKGFRAAFNHPGVVITAATGDDGWYGWDLSNDPGELSLGGASYPSTDPNVVAVAGTALLVDDTGKRTAETVWNDNGPHDSVGHNGDEVRDPGPQGASGGGCSRLYPAPAWQRHAAGYSAAGCRGKRLGADLAVVGAPQTGFDVFNSFGPAGLRGWQTLGGTSLSSPLAAAMFALAGGAKGSAYPAASLYANSVHRASSLFDVTRGGIGYCGGDTTAACSAAVQADFDGTTNNPNGAVGDLVDCSYPADGANPATAPALDPECNAAPGFDGASGLGAPRKPGLFASTAPTLRVRAAKGALRKGKAHRFGAVVREPIGGTKVTRYVWRWGDGKTTITTKRSVVHTYRKKGSHLITLTIADTLYQRTYAVRRFTTHA